MLIRIISQYLETHKRLVVPQLGAFIVKEPEHTVLFSELLKRDDGVLRGLLQAQRTAGRIVTADAPTLQALRTRRALARAQAFLQEMQALGCTRAEVDDLLAQAARNLPPKEEA